MEEILRDEEVEPSLSLPLLLIIDNISLSILPVYVILEISSLAIKGTSSVRKESAT